MFVTHAYNNNPSDILKKLPSARPKTMSRSRKRKAIHAITKFFEGKNVMALFNGWCSTTSRLEPLRWF